jgi:gliding motility-associated lipoprotein GldH
MFNIQFSMPARRSGRLNFQRLTSYFLLLTSYIFISSCSAVDLYEKTVAIPGHKWQGSFKPEFQFEIKDNTVPYNVFFVIRHTEKYNYNNIFINLSSKEPAKDSFVTQRLDVTLATNDKGWLGTGMDDIYEQRMKLSPGEGTWFPKPGTYTFRLEQIMRDQPLEHVMNAGIRIEKK